jgi:arylsulfatase A-like enzyme
VPHKGECIWWRVALITGCNHHSGGFGVITELSTGFPGYGSIIGADNATIGRILKDNGYATSWFGKNHNTPDFQYSLAGPFNQWPSGMGFDYFYGFVGGETDQWTPYLFQNNRQIFPWVGKPGYNLTTDMADEAISYMQGLKAAAPDSPWFVHYIPGWSHSPHNPKAQRGLDSEDSVLRDGLQSRDLPRWLVCQHDATAWAVDLERALALSDRLQVGIV